MSITIEQFQAQAQLIADLYMQITALQAENAELREATQCSPQGANDATDYS